MKLFIISLVSLWTGWNLKNSKKDMKLFNIRKINL